MARASNSEYMHSIFRALVDHDANELRGLSTRQIAEVTGISYHTVRRILTRPENGYLEAKALDPNGAATYYHSFEAMNQVETYKGVVPYDLEDSEKAKFLITNALNIIRMVDPLHEIVRDIKLEADNPDPVGESPKSKRRGQKTFWDYFATKEQTEYLYETLNLKEAVPKFHENLEKMHNGEIKLYLQSIADQTPSDSSLDGSMARTLLMFVHYYLNKPSSED